MMLIITTLSLKQWDDGDDDDNDDDDNDDDDDTDDDDNGDINEEGHLFTVM